MVKIRIKLSYLQFFKGAQEVFRELPYVYVEPHELKNVAQHGGKLNQKVNFLTLFFYLLHEA